MRWPRRSRERGQGGHHRTVAGAARSACDSLGPSRERTLAIAADLSSPQGPERLVAEAFAQCGRVDVLINNAGTPGPPGRAVWEAQANDSEDVWRTNVLAPAACAAAVVRRAKEERFPVRILNVSSGIVGLVLRSDTLGGVEATPFKGYIDTVLRGVTEPFEFAALHSSYFPVTFEKKESPLQLYLATMAGTRVMQQDMQAIRKAWRRRSSWPTRCGCSRRPATC
ncbi:MAG: SDR family NAD(P)-dependent oxidoreductase [Ramlibacter sp.]